jgi:hypothetical protein
MILLFIDNYLFELNVVLSISVSKEDSSKYIAPPEN